MKNKLFLVFFSFFVFYLMFPFLSWTNTNNNHIKEMERISIKLFEVFEEESDLKGYQIINGHNYKLPAGSTLDKQNGLFSWLPGPGFIGEYEFVFKSEKLGIEKKIKIYISPGHGEFHTYKIKDNLAASSSDQPFGSFDSPIDGSTVRGSIPVTGWTLDDKEIDSLKIYRLQESTLIYIGDAIMVEGARPDVAALYPNYPNNTKAGWGYMLLTNFLPDNGNGTFQIQVIAIDNDGNSTILGTKTIYADNANAVKPFGAIDTPSQGGTISGNNFINWGWTLTPQPGSIPIDGSTLKVIIDGVNIGNPTYDIYRSDIATLFPGYANTNGAVGYLSLDTSQYANGIHTIQWLVTDNNGNSDGIGSRYFMIDNPEVIAYTLGATKGTGIDGTPDSGSTSHNEGDIVNYSYTLQNGYRDLVVSLDGAQVADSGSITMNEDHALTATAEEDYDITGDWNLELKLDNVSADASILETSNVGIEFSGSLTSGNVFINGSNVGSYTVQNEVVSFSYTITDPILGQVEYVYTGQFDTNDIMSGIVNVYQTIGGMSNISGTMATIHVKSGKWSGKRKK